MFTLWISWATVLWAVAALIIRLNFHFIPHGVALAILASGCIAFGGGCLAIGSVLLGTRARGVLLAALAAAVLNFAYVALFLFSISRHVGST